MKTPEYRKHSSRDIAFVQWQKKRHYLPGKHNSAESRAAYRAFLIAHVFAEPQPPEIGGLTLLGMLSAFLDYARDHYGDGPRGEYANCAHAIRPLWRIYGQLPAHQFGPLKLKEWRKTLATEGKSRQYINKMVGKVLRAFRWAVSEELIQPAVYEAIKAVQPLREGDIAAAESSPRESVDWAHVQPVLDELSSVTRAMAELQWHTGARSGSIRRAMPSQFTREGDLLIWRPRHKQEHTKQELVIPLGPRCQALLAPFLEQAAPNEYIFSPRAQRKNRRYNKCYSTETYYRAISRAIDRVNKKIATENEKLPESKHRKPIPHWSPHQLRHSKATLIREKHGVEAAQAVLGQKSLEATQIYAERQLKLAKKIARKEG